MTEADSRTAPGTATGRPGSAGTASAADANRALLVILGLVLVAATVGASWDARWHGNHPLDDFFSPPHLFIYSCAALAMAVTGWLAANPRLRSALAPGAASVAGVPAPLVVLALGMAGIATAGPLDATWHTLWGLGETNWSTPHAMLGTGLTGIAFGYVSCRIALQDRRPPLAVTPFLVCLLLLFFTPSPFMGPLAEHTSREVLIASRTYGGLERSEDAQRGNRIQVEHNITRSHPAFPIVSSLWAGFAIELVSRIGRRRRHWLSAIGVFSVVTALSAIGTARYFNVPDAAANMVPIPILPAALVLVGARRALAERWAWLAAGLAFAVITYGVWGVRVSPVAALVAAALAPPAMRVGGRLGAATHQLIKTPRLESLRWLAAMVFALPLATGVIDGVLRISTP